MSASRAYKVTTTRPKVMIGKTRSIKRKKKFNQLRAPGMVDDVIVTPASEVASLIPGTYRTSNLWAMGLPGSAEHKFRDERFMATTALGSWNFQCLNNVPEGTGADLRQGRKITILNFHSRMCLTSNQANPVMWRVIFMIDKQANGTLPTASTLLQLTDSSGATVGDLVAFRNLDNVSRYEILYDKVHTINPPATYTSTGGTAMKYIKVSRKKPFDVEFSGSTGADNTIRSNSLVVAWFVSNTTGFTLGSGTMPAGMEAMCRIRYSDF